MLSDPDLLLAESRAPLSLRRTIVKHGVLLPIVCIARYANLAAGVRLTSTRERLDFASTAAVLDGGDARVLEQAFELFWRLRLHHPVEQLRAGLEPDDYIDAEDINPVTRSYVREAFHSTSLVQRSLEGELALPPP
jgi:signal-transduction protein with cAMP-binding, CBS, and nucleotidyltransferase domain